MASDKKIEDFLHLYFGCEFQRFAPSGLRHDNRKLTGAVIHEINSGTYPFTIKPLLRPLSDMSEEEEFEWSENGHKEADPMMAEAEATRYLLSKHFDLFNLIDAGIALDKTKI